MLKITSKDNEKIKLLKKLGQKKYREKTGKFLVENLNIIYDAKKSGVVFDSLFVTEGFIKKNKKDFDFISKDKDCFVITKEVNKFFSNLDTPSGICAVYKKEKRKIDFNLPIIYLNEINNPGNLGTIFRSAVAFNFKNVVLDEKCADLYNSKTISSAKDAIFKLNISFDENLKVFKKIKKEMKVFATDVLRGENIEKFKKEKKFCLVFGNEARGVDKKLKKLSDNFIKIKMSKEIESLNVAVSAGIILRRFYQFRVD